MSYDEDPNRATGRTTRMILEALTIASNGKDVAICTHAQAMRDIIMDKMATTISALGWGQDARFDGGGIMFNWGTRIDILVNPRPETTRARDVEWLVDHYLRDQLMGFAE